jgi:hypothetical protein
MTCCETVERAVECPPSSDERPPKCAPDNGGSDLPNCAGVLDRAHFCLDSTLPHTVPHVHSAISFQVYKQRVKHLLYEHQDERTRQKLTAQMALKVSQTDYRASEAELKADKRQLKVELKELQLAHDDFIVGLKTVPSGRFTFSGPCSAACLSTSTSAAATAAAPECHVAVFLHCCVLSVAALVASFCSVNQEHDKAITLKRFEFERECKELHNQYEERMKVILLCNAVLFLSPDSTSSLRVEFTRSSCPSLAFVGPVFCLCIAFALFFTSRCRCLVSARCQNLRAQLEAHRASDIQTIEERKARHVAALMKSHDAAFQEIKNYYNEITHSNLDLIHSLKEELHELKRKEATDDRLMFDIAQENKRMTEPLKRALADVEKLTEEREVYRCGDFLGGVCFPRGSLCCVGRRFGVPISDCVRLALFQSRHVGQRG